MVMKTYDVIVIGAGVSGSFMAKTLAESGQKVLILEAGSAFTRTNYPRKEIDANSRLYWGGGVELNTSSTLALLRPKVVGGGSIVNQALMDRFDDDALDSWRSQSGVSFFSTAEMASWYEKAEKELHIETISEKYRNGNAKIFADGFQKNGYTCAPLVRAQKNCRFEEGNDCIECLSGCPIDSKQSMPVTILRKALKAGAHIVSDFEVKSLKHSNDLQTVGGLWKKTDAFTFKAKKIVFAAGAIGNSRLLLQNDFKHWLPAIGENFFTHPQYMVLALYNEQINAHKGPLQSYKSYDQGFRKKGFKLENVFAPPVAISMLLPGLASKHQDLMKKITHMACIEVAVRDTEPGKISVGSNGKLHVHKELNSTDLQRRQSGMDAIMSIFHSTGAKQIIPGELGIGLHLMGGCSMGTDGKSSVVAPDFTMHDHKNFFVADSSIFPNAPGINPSLTIMALSMMASDKMVKEAR